MGGSAVEKAEVADLGVWINCSEGELESMNNFSVFLQINSLMFAFEDVMFVTIKRDRPSSRPTSAVHPRPGTAATMPVSPRKKPQPLPRKRDRNKKPVPHPRQNKPPAVVIRQHSKENRPVSVARYVTCMSHACHTLGCVFF